jgi:S1-C subfamily serine protease
MLRCTWLLLLCAQLPVIESQEFPRELQQSAITATVQLANKTGNRDGSGVIVWKSGPFVYILTADHIVDKADTVEVATFSEKSYPKPDKVYARAQVIARAREPDLALVRLITRDPLPVGLPICPPAQAPPDKEMPVLTCGVPTGKPPTCLADTTTGKKLIKKPSGEMSQVWELTRPQAPGASGGPLIDKRGFVLGVASGKSDEKSYYAHLDEIYRFLKQHNMEKLLAPPKD